MEKEEKIAQIALLGELMLALAEGRGWPGYESGVNESEFEALKSLIRGQFHQNGWFTEEEVCRALKAWGHELKSENLNNWLAGYDLSGLESKTIGIIMAGNIPLVGLHDLLSTLLSGHKAIVKTSKDDDQLIRAFFKVLCTMDERWTSAVNWADAPMKGYDAIIATGSTNTSRYFETYFGHVPHIIRKNRTSVAILNGSESDEQLKGLGDDVFAYFGLGCRNVTKLYVPEGYDLDVFFKAMFPYKGVLSHNKYVNNYDYHKAIYLLNEDELLENGFLLLKEDSSLHSPVACMFFEYYADEDTLRVDLDSIKEEIQCIISSVDTPFGKAQYPSLMDYADGEDTMAFLASL